MGFTAKKTIKMVIVGGAIAATAFLSACDGNNAAGNNSPAQNAPETTAAFGQAPEGNPQPDATQKQAGGQRAEGGGKSTPTKKSGGASNAGDVNCSKHGGQVGAPGRQPMDLIAVAATDGTTVGCTEAYNVITEYFEKLPQAEGPGERVLDVQGRWTCARLTESGIAVTCGVPNSSLQLETRP